MNNTISQAADKLNCSTSEIRKLLRQRRLAHMRIGTAIRIPDEAIAEFVTRNLVSVRAEEANAWKR